MVQQIFLLDGRSLLKDKSISSFIFLWLHNQSFYKKLQEDAITPIELGDEYKKQWIDVGCSTGLFTRLAQRLEYSVVGYDINSFSLLVARILSFWLTNISYKKDDFFALDEKFDIVSATSLISVVDNKEETLAKLVSLLKDKNSTLIIIEPTHKMTKKRVKVLMLDFKSFWFYKGLLLWASAREGKAVAEDIFNTQDRVKISHNYYLNDMVRVSYIKLL